MAIKNLLPPIPPVVKGSSGAGMFCLLSYRSISAENGYEGAGSGGTTYVLRLPKEVSDTFSMDWQQEAVGADFLNRLINNFFSGSTTGGGLARDGLGTIAEAFGLGGTVEAENQAAGKAINKINTLLFRSPNLRQFQLSWDFIPSSSKYAKDIDDFVKDIRENMHPEGRDVFAYPSVFDVKIVIQGKTIFGAKSAALTNFTYNPFGSGNAAFHDDGSPVHTSVTLEFQEIFPRTRTSITSLYSSS